MQLSSEDQVVEVSYFTENLQNLNQVLLLFGEIRPLVAVDHPGHLVPNDLYLPAFVLSIRHYGAENIILVVEASVQLVDLKEDHALEGLVVVFDHVVQLDDLTLVRLWRVHKSPNDFAIEILTDQLLQSHFVVGWEVEEVPGVVVSVV